MSVLLEKLSKRNYTIFKVLSWISATIAIGGLIYNYITSDKSWIILINAITFAICFLITFLALLVILSSYKKVLIESSLYRGRETELLERIDEYNKNNNAQDDKLRDCYTEIKKLKQAVRNYEDQLKFNISADDISIVLEEVYKIQFQTYNIVIKSKKFDKKPYEYFRNEISTIVGVIEAYTKRMSNEPCNIFLFRRSTSFKKSYQKNTKIEIVGASTKALRERRHLDSIGLNQFAIEGYPEMQKMMMESNEKDVERMQILPYKIFDDISNYEEMNGEPFSKFNSSYLDDYKTVVIYSLVHNNVETKTKIPEGFLWIDASTPQCLTTFIAKQVEPLAKMCYSLVYTINQFHFHYGIEKQNQ